MAIKAVLFDNDGTLVDTEGVIRASFLHATQTVLGAEGDAEAFTSMSGRPLDEMMREVSAEHADELLEVFRAHNHATFDEGVRVVPHALETLASLRGRDLHVAVVTSKLRWLAVHGLEILDLAEYVELVVTPEDTERPKPAPDPLLYACEQLGVEPAECLYVGDSPFDMQAAHAAGCVAVGYVGQGGMFGREVLDGEQPDYLVEDLREVVLIALTRE